MKFDNENARKFIYIYMQTHIHIYRYKYIYTYVFVSVNVKRISYIRSGTHRNLYDMWVCV